MMGRYEEMFKSLKARGESAFVPFVVIGDPDIETSVKIVRALADGGADALELGVPFSDPVADGPTIQAATVRAIDSGATSDRCFKAIAQLRMDGVEIPIGILSYANLAWVHGIESFYSRASEAGANSVLLADVPAYEAEPFVKAARNAGIHPILIAPPNSSDERLETIARLGGGYTYVLARSGITGASERLELDHSEILKKLHDLGAPPPLVGFGISKPEHVRGAAEAGAAGAISGSAVVKIVERNLKDEKRMLREIAEFVRAMKEATR
jgi:tryptophan synthase alpha chain